MREISMNIRRLRAEKGITKQELAKALNVTFDDVSEWENGTAAPDTLLLPGLSVFFGVTIDELFNIPMMDRFERIRQIIKEETYVSEEELDAEIKYLKDVECRTTDGVTDILLSGMYNLKAAIYKRAARDCIVKALELNLCSEDTLLELTKCIDYKEPERKLGNHFQLMELLKKCIQLNKDNKRLVYCLLEILIDEYRFIEAQNILNETDEKARDCRWFYFCALILWKKGENEESMAYLNEMIDRFSDTEDSYTAFLMYAKQMMCTHNYEKALEYFERAYESAPDVEKLNILKNKAKVCCMSEDISGEISERKRILNFLYINRHITCGRYVDEQRKRIQKLEKDLNLRQEN